MAAKKSKTRKKAAKKPVKKVSKASAKKPVKKVPVKKVSKETPKKEETSAPVFASYIKDKRVAYAAIAVLIILLLAWRVSTFEMPDTTGLADTTLQEGSAEAAEAGDMVKVEYTGVLASGEEFDSGELEFTLGAGEMIEGFDEAINGMKAGGEKTFTIPPEKAYGQPDPSMIVEVPLTRLLNKTVEITTADFKNTFGEDGVEGEEYFKDGMVWTIKVVSIIGDMMEIEHMPTDGMEIESPYGLETVKILGDTLEITLEPAVGQKVSTAYGEIEIASADEDSMELDFNHPLAGESLTFTVKVVEIAEGGTEVAAPAVGVCEQLGITKSDRPTVDLFIMSYCPYGLQMQKAALPAMELLGDKADFNVKWVSYVMHGLKEIEENNNQYCIQSEYPDKYIDYANCFTLSDDADGCMQENGIDKTVIDACIAIADEEFKTMELYGNQSTWSNGRYPQYNLHLDENQLYGVGGSPTTVINGKVVSVNRSPEDVKVAVCCAFNVMPEECSQTLSTAAASPGIGGGTGTANTAECA